MSECLNVYSCVYMCFVYYSKYVYLHVCISGNMIQCYLNDNIICLFGTFNDVFKCATFLLYLACILFQLYRFEIIEIP